jgi:O-antigen ligase
MGVVSRRPAKPPPAPASREVGVRLEALKHYGLIAALAAATTWLAYHHGMYALTSRNALAIVLWWMIVLIAALSLASFERPTRASLVAVGSLAALAVLSLVSAAWADSAEHAFAEFNRAMLYLAVLLVAAVAATRSNPARWASGFGIAVTVISLLALGSRLLPNLVSTSEIFRFLPAQSRLAYPIGYWNGLAAFVALGVPLLLHRATTGESAVLRGLGVASLPALAAVLYLTSSRGGILATAVGVLLFLALTPRRVAAAAALAIAGIASAVVVAALADRPELANGPFGTDLVERHGREVAFLLVATSLAAGAIYAIGWRLTAPRLSPSPASERAVLAVAVVTAFAAIVALDPVDRVREFRTAPSISSTNPDYVREHLLSGSGNGRWQMWSAAIDEFRAHPAFGGGAGSYQTWWEQHRDIPLFVIDAHSLYFEMLGELGLLGLALVLTLVGAGLGVGIARVRHSQGEQAVTLAALTAAVAAFAFMLGVDWIWEVTAVSVPGIVMIGLLVGRPGTAPGPRRLGRIETRSTTVRGAAVVVGLIAVAALAVPLLAELQLRASEKAARRGSSESAVRHANAARRLEPWAATPYLQLALLNEDAGDWQAARRSIDSAVQRDASNWKLWLIAARIQTRAGAIAVARKSLHRAKALNPFWARSLPSGRGG